MSAGNNHTDECRCTNRSMHMLGLLHYIQLL